MYVILSVVLGILSCQTRDQYTPEVVHRYTPPRSLNTARIPIHLPTSSRPSLSNILSISKLSQSPVDLDDDRGFFCAQTYYKDPSLIVCRFSNASIAFGCRLTLCDLSTHLFVVVDECKCWVYVVYPPPFPFKLILVNDNAAQHQATWPIL